MMDQQTEAGLKRKGWGEGVQSRDEQRQLKRMAILRAAAQAFNQAGFHQTSLTDLAALLNVTKPTLYYYVKNKDDILQGILDVAGEQLRIAITTELDTFPQERPQANGLDKLRHFFKQYAAMMTDDFGACLIFDSCQCPRDQISRTLSYRLTGGRVSSTSNHF